MGSVLNARLSKLRVSKVTFPLAILKSPSSFSKLVQKNLKCKCPQHKFKAWEESNNFLFNARLWFKVHRQESILFEQLKNDMYLIVNPVTGNAKISEWFRILPIGSNIFRLSLTQTSDARRLWTEERARGFRSVTFILVLHTEFSLCLCERLLFVENIVIQWAK